MKRKEVLSRYRRDRALAKRFQSDACRHTTKAGILRQAKRLGMLEEGIVTAEDEDDLNFVFDLLIYTASGRSLRAIDRLARAERLAPGSDEARVLAALRITRFGLYRIRGRHLVAGLRLLDVLRQDEVWLMDESLEASARPGMVLGSRLAFTDDFAMTCGVLVPIGGELLAELLAFMNEMGVEPAILTDELLFAEAVYRMALELGLNSLVRFR